MHSCFQTRAVLCGSLVLFLVPLDLLWLCCISQQDLHMRNRSNVHTGYLVFSSPSTHKAAMVMGAARAGLCECKLPGVTPCFQGNRGHKPMGGIGCPIKGYVLGEWGPFQEIPHQTTSFCCCDLKGEQTSIQRGKTGFICVGQRCHLFI